MRWGEDHDIRCDEGCEVVVGWMDRWPYWGVWFVLFGWSEEGDVDRDGMGMGMKWKCQ